MHVHVSVIKMQNPQQQICIYLEDLLHATGDLVVLSSDDVGVHDTGR